jgi:hypothetical protein
VVEIGRENTTSSVVEDHKVEVVTLSIVSLFLVLVSLVLIVICRFFGERPGIVNDECFRLTIRDSSYTVLPMNETFMNTVGRSRLLVGIIYSMVASRGWMCYGGWLFALLMAVAMEERCECGERALVSLSIQSYLFKTSLVDSRRILPTLFLSNLLYINSHRRANIRSLYCLLPSSFS